MFAMVTDEDLPTLVALVNRAYRGSDPTAWSTESAYLSGDRTSVALLRADLRARPAASFLKWVAQDDRILGCVWLEPIADDVWYLGTLAVDPALQASGLGRQLLAAAEDWVRERHARKIRMTVINVREALIGWYVRRGYRVTGETEAFPYEDDRFGTPLRDDLAFIVLEKDLAG